MSSMNNQLDSKSFEPIQSKVAQEASDKCPSSTVTNVHSEKHDNLIHEHSASFGGGNNVLEPLHNSDSMGSEKALQKLQKHLEENKDNAKKVDPSLFNHPSESEEEKKAEQSICNKDEGSDSYIKRIEQLKSDAQKYAEKSKAEKAKYMEDFNTYYDQLHLIIRSSSKDKAGLAAIVEAIELNLGDFLSSWGPKRGLMYLKLTSVYSKIGKYGKAEMLNKAEDNLNGMSDTQDIAECRRWLCLQRIESCINNDPEGPELNKEEFWLDQCWNVKQRYFEGRRDFLDFYSLFFAKHLLRKGEYKKAEEVYKDALVLRRQREAFWKQDDFNWDKLKEEMEKEIGENIK